MAKRKTNVQLVKQMMEFSPHGALAQLFVMQALDKYAQMCIDATPDQLANGLIDGAAWQAVAKDIKRQMDEHYQ